MEIDLSTSCKNPFWQYLWDESIKKLKAFAFSLTQLCDAGVVVFFLSLRVACERGGMTAGKHHHQPPTGSVYFRVWGFYRSSTRMKCLGLGRGAAIEKDRNIRIEREQCRKPRRPLAS